MRCVAYRNGKSQLQEREGARRTSCRVATLGRFVSIRGRESSYPQNSYYNASLHGSTSSSRSGGSNAAGHVSNVAMCRSIGTETEPVPTSTVWELDFCSRPLIDERGKKIWELLICDPSKTFEYSVYFPNNKINSTELKKALEAVLMREGAVRPEKVLFFRSQMQTIITRALNELNIQAVPSRRCFALISLLEDRLEHVYKKDARYSEKASTLFTLNMGAPEELPDALRGESWSFVQLPLGALRSELDQVLQGNAFGRVLDVDSLNIDDVNDDTLIPGVAIYSRRANPLAAWTNGLELAAVVADTERAFLILETGVTERWKYGAYRRTQETTEEAEAWERAKQAVGGLHFVAVMTDEEADDCSGLWLLCDRKPPTV